MSDDRPAATDAGTILDRFEQDASTVSDLDGLDELRANYLGRKRGAITALFQSLRDLDGDAKREAGAAANRARQQVSARIDEIEASLAAAAEADREQAETVDVTLPGRPDPLGGLHPITQTLLEIQNVFVSMGYQVVDGPEVESDWYNFGALNFPEEHPARDEQDTLMLAGDLLLRTHTSPVQIRYMETHEPPLAIIVPGRVFRRDTPDATHTPMFVQCEGLVVGTDITMADLKETLDHFAKALFGPETQTRFRPGYFPFTEPSAEVDATCPAWRRRRLSSVQGIRLGRAPWLRHGSPCPLRERRLRLREGAGIRVRHGSGPDHRRPLRIARHPRLLRQRPALPAPVLLRSSNALFA